VPFLLCACTSLGTLQVSGKKDGYGCKEIGLDQFTGKGYNMKPASLIKSISIDQLYIRDGEYVTVWLDVGGGLENVNGHRVQVELRVDGAGNPNVLLKKEDMHIVKTFEEVY